MIERKKKIKFFQISLLLIGATIVFSTYFEKKLPSKKNIISKEKQEKVKKQLSETPVSGDVFYDISYSGLDLAGNRYILRSKEAINKKESQEIVIMKSVDATFYFKDDTILYVRSENGIYNNKTLDMSFENNVRADYGDNKLFSQKATYSNSKSFLKIHENVKVEHTKGTMFADELLFDIKMDTLNIASYTNNNINANLKLK